MKDLNYGKGYSYAHEQTNALVMHKHLPKELDGTKYFQATDRGYEKTINARLAWLAEQRHKNL